MANEFLIRKAGQPILSTDDWLRVAPPPEAAAEWMDGSPLREFARLFFNHEGRVQVPQVIGKLLTTHAGLGAVTLQSMIPEYLIAIDAQPGGSQRCHAVAIGTCREGRVAVTHHARTEEGFGPLVSDQLKRGKPGSQWAARADRLAGAVLGRPLEACGNLRGELLRLAAAALRVAETEKSGTAVLFFHEFRPKAARAPQVKRNADDLDAFVKALGGKPLKDGFLMGPFRVPGGHEVPASVPLYVGKMVTLL
jgi:hypothetical protein